MFFLKGFGVVVVVMMGFLIVIFFLFGWFVDIGILIMGFLM